MQESVTVTLPPDVRQALDEITEQEGIPREDVIHEAIRRHVFVRQFRRLRERLMQHAASEGVLTDQDVFDQVS